MTESEAVPPDANLCAVCRTSLESASVQRFLAVEDERGFEIWANFCSWAHLAEWTSGPEPEFPDSYGDSDWLDGIAAFGCLTLIAVMVALAVVGGIVTVRAVF